MTNGAIMSFKNRSDVENHLSTGSKRIPLHLRPAAAPDVTGDSAGGVGAAVAIDAETAAGAVTLASTIDEVPKA
jgi:hypothetical protein